MRFAATHSIVVGILMIGQWAFSLATKQVPEVETEPIRIAYHLVAEFLTAILLVVGGIGVFRSARWGRPLTLLALGMLIYTEIVSQGYFGHLGQWPMVVMFVLLLLLAVVSAFLVFRAQLTRQF